MMTEYAAIFEQADDGSWSARTPDLPAFAAGRSREEAAANLREAIGLYLQELRDRGEPVPQARSSVGVVSI